MLGPFPYRHFFGQIVVCDETYDGTGIMLGENVLAGGAGGMVLVQASDTNFYLMAEMNVLPATYLTHQDGLALKKWLATGSDHTAALEGFTVKENDTARADIMAGYSARGPSPSVGQVIKPDVCAPGQNILAAYGQDGEIAWNVEKGTSMASPHAAGAAALLKAVRPDLTPAEIQSALTTTARISVMKDKSRAAADPFDMGGGRIDIGRAARAALVLDETLENYQAANPGEGGDPSTLNLATLGYDEVTKRHAWTRTLRSTLNKDSVWTASVTNPEGALLTVTPGAFTIPGGGTREVRITVDFSQPVFDRWLFGQVAFQADGQVTASLPVAVKQVLTNLEKELDLTDVNMNDSTAIHMKASLDITDFTTVVSGLAPGAIYSEDIYQDPTPSDIFDDLTPEGGVLFKEMVLGDNVSRLLAEIIATTSPDLDLYVAKKGGEIICRSAKDESEESCEIDSPPAGTYWIVVQNYMATDTTGSSPDSTELLVAQVPGTDTGNLEVIARTQEAWKPTAIPAGEGFELFLKWNLNEDSPYWYGVFTIGTDSANPANLAEVKIKIVHNNLRAASNGECGGSGCFLQTTR